MSGSYADVRQAVDHFDVDEDFVYDIAAEMNHANRRAFKAGGKWRIDVEDMEAYLIERTREHRANRAARRQSLSDLSSTTVVPDKIKKSW